MIECIESRTASGGRAKRPSAKSVGQHASNSADRCERTLLTTGDRHTAQCSASSSSSPSPVAPAPRPAKASPTRASLSSCSRFSCSFSASVGLGSLSSNPSSGLRATALPLSSERDACELDSRLVVGAPAAAADGGEASESRLRFGEDMLVVRTPRSRVQRFGEKRRSVRSPMALVSDRIVTSFETSQCEALIGLLSSLLTILLCYSPHNG